MEILNNISPIYIVDSFPNKFSPSPGMVDIFLNLVQTSWLFSILELWEEANQLGGKSGDERGTKANEGREKEEDCGGGANIVEEEQS